MFIRRSLLISMGAAAMLLASFIPAAEAASASTGTAAQPATGATRYQNTTIAAALANNPSGTRMGSSQVEWNGGTVIMTVPASPDAGVGGCPSGILTGQWTCVYNKLSFKGTRLQFQDAGYYQNLRQYGGTNWDTLSYSNTRGQRSWLNAFTTSPHSPIYCMTGNSAGSNIQGAWSADQWILLTSNYARC